MPDLRELLQKPTDSFKRPPVLPAGNYTGIVTKQSYDKANNQDKTDICRYMVRLTGPVDGDVDPEDLVDQDGNPIDFNSIPQQRMDYWLDDRSIYRLKEFLDSCGVETSGRSLGECIPEAKDAEVIATVVRTPDKNDSSKVFNNINSLRGTARA